ncbi:MAG: hypothetical protein AVDCRST_MAG50-2702, partial [uncultured Acidimicrobiales bacterium]
DGIRSSGRPSPGASSGRCGRVHRAAALRSLGRGTGQARRHARHCGGPGGRPRARTDPGAGAPGGCRAERGERCSRVRTAQVDHRPDRRHGALRSRRSR